MDCKNNLIPFSFNCQEVRAILIESQPWFVAKDVCDVLELSNPTEALRSLDDDERNTLRIPEGIPSKGNPNMNIISESGLYALIFKSRKPEAKAFRKWVTSTVLPTLFRTGRFEAHPSGSDRRDIETGGQSVIIQTPNGVGVTVRQKPNGGIVVAIPVARKEYSVNGK